MAVMDSAERQKKLGKSAGSADPISAELVESHPRRPQASYFPASFEHTFGPLPIPPIPPPRWQETLKGRKANVFPHNLSFRTADWVENEIPEDADGYDVVIA